MIQHQLKLRPCKAQEKTYDQWLFHLAPVYNFGVRKIELNAQDKIYFSKQEFQNLLANHGQRLGIPSHTLQGVLCTVHDAWKRCFKKIAGKPRLKGMRNKLTSIPFPDPIQAPKGSRITLPGLGSVRFHKQEIPEGRIKCGRLVKRATGWYLCLFIDAEPNAIKRLAFGEIGIDPGFSSLLTTSDGEIIEHPREWEGAAERLAQAQRGHDKQLAARLQERIANRKKDRNHKLTTRLVAENVLIVWSKDNTKGIAKRFGKSVSSSAHAQIRGMLSYKSPTSGTTFIEAASKDSTKNCSVCHQPTGPSGLAGLSVRSWVCRDCGASHDRDVNAAINTLSIGAGCAHEVAYV
jgi:transposase